MQLHLAAQYWASCFNKNGPNSSPWGCTWRSSANLFHANLEKNSPHKRVHMNHEQYRSKPSSHALSYAAKKGLLSFSLMHSTHLHIYRYKTSVTPPSHGVMPGNTRSSLLRRCQKEDSPHLDLVWVSRAGDGALQIQCTVVVERGRADVGGGGLSYGLGNFNDMVCEKIFRGNYTIIEKHRVQFYCITTQTVIHIMKGKYFTSF